MSRVLCAIAFKGYGRATTVEVRSQWRVKLPTTPTNLWIVALRSSTMRATGDFATNPWECALACLAIPISPVKQPPSPFPSQEDTAKSSATKSTGMAKMFALNSTTHEESSVELPEPTAEKHTRLATTSPQPQPAGTSSLQPRENDKEKAEEYMHNESTKEFDEFLRKLKDI
ncbi:hypothetical protein CRG98_008913 [Punica granatum]|uniref:Uncharacterized protein n=1 Tax=Punica granatum TaxID=22663 RepID=A0A2I0KQT2_PUNGR|nr:hypothetical protein CRG98_008913 [Punica granatum]